MIYRTLLLVALVFLTSQSSLEGYEGASYSIASFGARADDQGDDTAAIQRAIDAAARDGVRELIFPRGRYIVRSVSLHAGLRYNGYGATIVRPANQGAWMRSFVLSYSGVRDSQMTEITGFNFDGQSVRQGAYKRHQLSQAHFIMLAGDARLPGRLRITARDMSLANGVGDGISIYTNVDSIIDNIVARDVFRGGLVVTGGNTKVLATRIRTEAGPNGDPGGIDFEVDGAGYGGRYNVDATLSDIELVDGDFDVSLRDRSTFVGRNIRSLKPPFNLGAHQSTIILENSSFKIGRFDGYVNRLVCPQRLTIRNSELTAELPRGVSEGDYGIFNIWWSHAACGGTMKGESILLENNRFDATRAASGSEQLSVVLMEADRAANGNTITFRGGEVSSRFTNFAILRDGGRMQISQLRASSAISILSATKSVRTTGSALMTNCEFVDTRLFCS